MCLSFYMSPWEEGKRQIPREERILLLPLVIRSAHDMRMCVSMGTLLHISVKFREVKLLDHSEEGLVGSPTSPVDDDALG